ncbi:carbohydrate sulfotransferase 6 isoform X1 [Folsomia candida]|uniref:carbohydrate sulfotransferase 6 isoform X1 n=1 Tax=Folsomia candida TaxID=158441 RepID=UPI000B8FA904|nr:carbohydrate sulfotransferase 6 isoform X1 [Folsomia candida]
MRIVNRKLCEVKRILTVATLVMSLYVIIINFSTYEKNFQEGINSRIEETGDKKDINYLDDDSWGAKHPILKTDKSATLQNMIISTWRSGSTFVGEAVASHPETYYHFEPLNQFRIVQARSGEPFAQEATQLVKNLMKCDYSSLQEYIEFGVEHVYPHNHNPKVWVHCERQRHLCADWEFLSKTCNSVSIQLMKAVRFRLSLAESLLSDDALNLRVLFLVRDPRGSLLSRRNLTWCQKSPDCFDTSRVCADMVADFKAGAKLRDKYPGQIKFIRYEDLMMNVEPEIKSILRFFRLDYHPDIQNFIASHTVTRVGNDFSTFRDSKTMPFHWIDHYLQDNNDSHVLQNIETQCQEAMNLWGYEPLPFTRIGESTIAVPLLPPPWPEMKIASDD